MVWQADGQSREHVESEKREPQRKTGMKAGPRLRKPGPCTQYCFSLVDDYIFTSELSILFCLCICLELPRISMATPKQTPGLSVAGTSNSPFPLSDSKQAHHQMIKLNKGLLHC